MVRTGDDDMNDIQTECVKDPGKFAFERPFDDLAVISSIS